MVRHILSNDESLPKTSFLFRKADSSSEEKQTPPGNLTNFTSQGSSFVRFALLNLTTSSDGRENSLECLTAKRRERHGWQHVGIHWSRVKDN